MLESAALTTIALRFGNCRAVEPISSGPLTDVYRAVQEPSGLEVVVKALRPMIAPSSPFAAQLEREAQLLARLHHQNVVQLYDFVKTDATMWLVLERVDGFALEQVLASAGRLSPEAALAIGVEIAHALAHAHERGVIHRGIEPGNVLVSRRGEIKLADFAVAHDDRMPSSPEPFETGSTFGEPSYMSPEQILGETVDPRTDVFSLGVVLYQLVAGVRPFDGADSRTTAHRIRHEPAPPLRAIVPNLPRAFERIVMRCLEKTPGERFASASELGAALEGALRAGTNAPRARLIGAELVRAKLVDHAPAASIESGATFAEAGARSTLVPTIGVYLGLLALVAIGGGVIQWSARREADAGAAGQRGPLELVPPSPGSLRVVAHPWARVVVDGQLVDTTPFARAIPLPPGTHYVTLKHPNASDERRVVRIASGETVLLDVTMGVSAPAPVDAGADARSFVETAAPIDAGTATP